MQKFNLMTGEQLDNVVINQSNEEHYGVLQTKYDKLL